MELFNKFRDTVFYKDDSDLEKQLRELKSIRDKLENKEEIDKDIKLLEYGIAGEKEIAFELKNANIGMYVLHDVNLVYGDIKAQIDYIVVTPAYNYFIECKNLYGNIVVDAQGNFNRYMYFGNRKVTEGMYNPLSQAQRHIEIYKKIWNEHNTDLFRQLISKRFLDTWNKSLVVMANSKNILNLKDAPQACKEKVIKSDNLVDYIKKDMKTCNKSFWLNKKELYEIAKVLLLNYNKEIEEDYIAKYKEKFNLTDEVKTVEVKAVEQQEEVQEFTKAEPKVEVKVEPKIEVKEEVTEVVTVELDPEKEKLKAKLIEFRKARSIEKNIPAYYVFTNAELDAILELMPKTLEELQESKVLQKIKVISHGKEIIAVINEES